MWVAQQTRNAIMEFGDDGGLPTFLMHDCHTKFTKQFDDAFRCEGVRAKRNTPLSPNLNAYVERYVQSIKHECLDHVVVIGQKHLNHLVSEYVAYYHEARPHQGVGNVLLNVADSDDGDVLVDCVIVRRERLGGLLKSYGQPR